MAHLSKGTFRNSTGWLRQSLSKRTLQGLKTDGQTDDELWILLEYYSEVIDVGTKHLLTQGIPKKRVKQVYKHFQSYIRQAKNYYLSAKTLHPRSSALLYYYCFLNLAKAAVIQKNYSIGGVKIGHGISCFPKDFTKIRRQTVKVLDNGMFQEFYNSYYGFPIKKQSLNVEQLLTYCSEISYQCMIAGFGQRKVDPCYYVNVVNSTDKTAWPLIGIPNFNVLKKYQKSLVNFLDKFEMVEVPKLYSRDIFKEDKENLASFTFFQSKQTFPWIGNAAIPDYACRDLALKSLGSIAQVNYFEDGYDFVIALPYKINRQVPINETIAIYLVMFYLSNLVRYNPSYLEELLTKKEAWIIDSFIKSCSLTFLRAMVSRIVGTDFVISRR
jgi:hypothetical protein